MVKAYQKHPFEVRIARVLIALFTLFVLLGLYYIFGGPVPYFINWDGPAGEGFTGQYEVLRDLPTTPEEALASAPTFEATYPYTAMVWGGRRANIVAASQNLSELPSLNGITVRRAGVVCSEAQRWGVQTSVVCDDKHTY